MGTKLPINTEFSLLLWNYLTNISFIFFYNLRITRQGLPTAIESEGISFTTTLPAPSMVMKFFYFCYAIG